jgi:hypothetical protein
MRGLPLSRVLPLPASSAICKLSRTRNRQAGHSLITAVTGLGYEFKGALALGGEVARTRKLQIASWPLL